MHGCVRLTTGKAPRNAKGGSVPLGQGQNWHTLASLPAQGMQTADIVGAFVRQGRFRIEFYLDDSNELANKARFDVLNERRAE
jgi:hypothetical protein